MFIKDFFRTTAMGAAAAISVKAAIDAWNARQKESEETEDGYAEN
ncbi:MAG: hypothetical protein PHW33_01755 [Candidatus Portnoybacteria bacterium]|nr:hypothetical protein [Candidatus Portnoybacteria bacterium]